jgi:uroporphyrinogen decarboxylase
METLERFLSAARMEEPDEVPVSLLTSARFFSRFYGIKVFKFFHNPQVMLEATLHTMKLFPDIVFFPGLWADYGIVVEPSAFGSRIYWPENFVPYVKGQLFKDPEEIRNLEPPDPKTDGLMPFVLESIRYIQKHAPQGVKYLYAIARGPFQVASYLRGPTEFLIDLRVRPDVAQKLIDVCTETTIQWLNVQLEVIDQPIGIFVPDDVASFLSPELFEKFGLPAYKRIFSGFDGLLKVYHNHADSTHILDRLSQCNFHVFNFSPATDIQTVKNGIGKKVCLMGNIDPVNLLLRGTPKTVEEECRRCIQIGAPGGGYILSLGGGPSMETPEENMEAMVKAAKKYGRYPIQASSW